MNTGPLSQKLIITLLAALISGPTIGNSTTQSGEQTPPPPYQTVNGTITWSQNGASMRSSFDKTIVSRSKQLRQYNGLFWQDTSDSKEKVIGPIAAAEYCEELVIQVDGLNISGFRPPTKSEINGVKNSSFSYGGSVEKQTQQKENSSKRTSELQRTGVYSATSSKKNEDQFERCVADRLTFDNATIYDIALFISSNDKDYLTSLEKALHIKYGKPEFHTSYQSNKISAEITSSRTKKIAVTADDIKSLLPKKSNRLIKKKQSSDKSVTILGVYNFRNETIVELKINKRLQGLNLDKLNARYAIVDSDEKTPGGAWNRKGSHLKVFPFKEGRIYYELVKGDQVYFSVPKIRNDRFDLPPAFVGTRKTAVANVALKSLEPTDKTFSQYEFSSHYNYTADNRYLASIREILDDANFSPTVKLNVSRGVLSIASVDEIENHKYNIEKAELQRASNSIEKLNLFVKNSSTPEFTDQALKRMLDLSFKSLKEINSFLDNYSDTKYRDRALKQALKLSSNNINHLNTFISRKPGAALSNQAHQAILNLSFDSIDKLNRFLTKHPTTEQKNAALDQILKLSFNSIELLNQFAKTHSKSEQSKQAISQVLHLSKGSIANLNRFVKTYPGNVLVVKAEKQIASLESEGENRRLAKIETKNRYVYGNMIGPKTLSGARFIRGLIWQDQAINSSGNLHDFAYAKDYCGHLNLLGVDGWRLPSVADLKQLGSDVDQLAYRTASSDQYNYYFTETDGCTQSGASALSAAQCVYATDLSRKGNPYIAKVDKATPASVRCVLGTDQYNQYQRTFASEQLKLGGFSGYLNAFNATGNQAHIQQAYRLAKTNADKANIELALIRHFGIDSVFRAVGTLSGNTNSATSDTDNGDWLFTSIDSSGNAVVNISASRKLNSNVPLTRGQFRVQVRVSLELHFRPTGGQTAGVSSKHVEQIAWIDLNKSNNYSNSTPFDFGEPDKEINGERLSNGTGQLKSITPKITFEAIELM